ncbi:MAG: pilin [Gammaproteobacteria bacterium]|nr:pilin [Gammaproteobacteria bacterium]
MAEALELMGATKVPLEEYFVDRGTWPSSIGSVVNTVSGKYTATIAGAPGGTTSTYIITATMRSTGISSVLAGRTAQFLTIDAARTWNCQVGGPAPVEDQYLPSVCR